MNTMNFNLQLRPQSRHKDKKKSRSYRIFNTLRELFVVPPDQMSNLIDENFEQIYEELKQFYTLKEFIEPVLNEIQKGQDSHSSQEEGL